MTARFKGYLFYKEMTSFRKTRSNLQINIFFLTFENNDSNERNRNVQEMLMIVNNVNDYIFFGNVSYKRYLVLEKVTQLRIIDN